MCEVKKYGLIHDSFLVDMAKVVDKIPKNFNSGFTLHIKVYNDELRLWLPLLSRIVVSGSQVFLYYQKYGTLCFENKDINAFKIEYDDLLAEYNGECIDAETKDMFNLSVWEQNTISVSS